MTKFKVLASYKLYCMVEIEAEDEDEAWEIASNMDGGSFEPSDNGEGSWYIEEVTEV